MNCVELPPIRTGSIEGAVNAVWQAHVCFLCEIGKQSGQRDPTARLIALPTPLQPFYACAGHRTYVNGVMSLAIVDMVSAYLSPGESNIDWGSLFPDEWGPPAGHSSLNQVVGADTRLKLLATQAKYINEMGQLFRKM
jgi:hypothetical protein